MCLLFVYLRVVLVVESENLTSQELMTPQRPKSRQRAIYPTKWTTVDATLFPLPHCHSHVLLSLLLVQCHT